jgi:hypothetical protein
MIKYFKNTFTIFKVDVDRNEVTSVTNHPENKGIVYSFGTEMIAQSMLDSMNSQLGIVRPGGWVTVETDENQFNQYKQEVREYFISGSVDF